MTRAERWRREQELFQSTRPRIRLHAVRTEPAPDGRGYAVHIAGVNLWSAGTRPRVIVGGLDAGEVVWAPDGSGITGRLGRRPDALATVVDYGFVRAEWGSPEMP